MQAESSSSPVYQAQADAALPLFARGVISLLTIWPALRLAITNDWAPPPRSSAYDAEYPPETAAERRIRMAEELVDAYYSAYAEKLGAKPEITDIEDFLIDFFEYEYGVKLEDGSEVTLAQDVEGCWEECLRRSQQGSNAAATTEEGLLERLDRMAKKAREEDQDPSKALKGTRTGEQDEDDDSESENEVTKQQSSHALMNVDDEEVPQLQPTPRQKEEPIVDDDGFTTVVRKKGGR